MLVLPVWATCLDHLAKQGWGEGARYRELGAKSEWVQERLGEGELEMVDPALLLCKREHRGGSVAGGDQSQRRFVHFLNLRDTTASL